jgi:hypothetical protein
MESTNKFDYIKNHKILFIISGIMVVLILIIMMFSIKLDPDPNAAANATNVKEFEI